MWNILILEEVGRFDCLRAWCYDWISSKCCGFLVNIPHWVIQSCPKSYKRSINIYCPLEQKFSGLTNHSETWVKSVELSPPAQEIVLNPAGEIFAFKPIPVLQVFTCFYIFHTKILSLEIWKCNTFKSWHDLQQRNIRYKTDQKMRSKSLWGFQLLTFNDTCKLCLLPFVPENKKLKELFHMKEKLLQSMFYFSLNSHMQTGHKINWKLFSSISETF